ncbi:MAG TPA: NAD(+) synthase [Usitatibacter sp.]|jgi:NAD+ synthase|nr:NAD(+) synthase [Usitatibacter sp.]
MDLAAPALHPGILDIDAAAEVERIAHALRSALTGELRRRGLIVAMSGGVDSSVCAALAVRAVGASKVHALMLPEHESSDFSLTRAQALAQQLGIEYTVEAIGPALEAIGCYARRDAAMREVFPAYASTWKSKISIAGGRDGGFNYFKLTVQSPDGKLHEARLPHKQYLQVVAATSFKQRLRKTMEYYHADRLHYAVVGTPNRLEYDQGFFVKNGDGSADLKPIAHLYKTQVYALARHLDIPREIREAPPTTDTYTLDQGQDEFYFALRHDRMDVALWAYNHGIPAAELEAFLELPAGTGAYVYRDIESKRAATRYLHARPVLVEPLPELGH